MPMLLRLLLVLLMAATAALATPAPATATRGQGATLRLLSFTPTLAQPIYAFGPVEKRLLALAQSTIQVVPEGLALQSLLTTSATQLGLTPDEASGLLAGVRTAYAAMAADPLFKGVPTAMPGCFSQQPGRQAQYFLYRPDPLRPDTPAIVWLHGYGGNLMFYAWVLQAAFPDHVLILPSFGLTWEHGTAAHLDEVLADAARQLGQPIERPWLMAISAGGPAGFRIYADRARQFRGLLAIATWPGPDPLPALAPASRILMLNGTRDRGFPLALVRERAAVLHRQHPGFRYRELAADHFFLLTQREATTALMRQFMAALMVRDAVPPAP